MTVYILAQDARVGSLNRLTASLGFAQMGAEVVEYTDQSFDDVPLEDGDIVVGGIGYVRRAFERLGLDVPHLDPVPDALRPFAGRKLWRTTLAELRQAVNDGARIFAKPAPDQPKLFTGRVLSEFRDLIATAHLDGDLTVDCAEPVRFVSEFRTFVAYGSVLDLRPYTGNPLLFPDPEVIRAAIQAYDAAPASYSLDVGVTEDGRTRLVEVNDAYALGCYGLFPTAYARFIKTRWDELYRTAK